LVQAALPVIAGVGGMVAPALVYIEAARLEQLETARDVDALNAAVRRMRVLISCAEAGGARGGDDQRSQSPRRRRAAPTGPMGTTGMPFAEVVPIGTTSPLCWFIPAFMFAIVAESIAWIRSLRNSTCYRFSPRRPPIVGCARWF
jgi:hypothetical protein